MAAKAVMLFLIAIGMYLVGSDAQTLVEGEDYVAALSFSSATTLAGEDDGVSGPILKRTGFPIGGALQYYAYVGTNGIISFGKGFRFYQPEPFPTSSDAIQSHIVIAPFWSDNDVRLSGNVSYEVFSNPSSSAITNISSFIQSQIGTLFRGTWMLLAEWSNVHPFPHGVNGSGASTPFYMDYTTQTNTYQAVLVTDETSSYAVFTYNCDEMAWSGDVWGNNSATIGYSLEGKQYMNNPFTNLMEAHKIGCVNSPDTKWNNVLLNLSAPLSDADDIEKQLCEELIREDDKKYLLEGVIFSIVPTLEECPCSQIQARNDWRFRPDDNVDVDGLLCYFQRFPSVNGGSQYCCYSSNGALTQTVNETYGTNMVVNHPLTQMEHYIKYDRALRETCCNAGLCNSYTSRRPASKCQNYIAPFLALVVGNLHFTTLDGFTYTFNGLGDYLLLNDTNSTFQVQVRTKDIIPGSYKATQLEALALGEEGSVVKVCLTEVGSFEIQYNKEVIPIGEVALYENGDFYSNPNNTIKIQMTEEGPPQPISLLISFANGIMAIVNKSADSTLSFTLWVPESFQGLTTGLLGNFNGDSSDDLSSSNMTVLAENATDEQIYEFGENWRLNDSFFDMQVFPPFTPTFVQDALKNATTAMETQCNGTDFCIFDAVVTGDIDAAVETLKAVERNVQHGNELGNFPPEIQVTQDPPYFFPHIILVTSNGTAFNFYVNVSDVNGDNFTTSVNAVPSNLLTNNSDVNDGFGNYSISWSIGDPTDLQILIESTDDRGASSQVQLQVFICVCGNGGTCSSLSFMASFGNDINIDTSTVIIPCDCNQAWTGPHCTVNIDGCSEGECYGDSPCFDSDEVGVSCPADCGTGLMKDGEKCYDIDDCPSSSCEQMCVNNFGSPHSCECFPGYQMVNETCEDIDECAGFTGCHQKCNDTDGGYDCDCLPGYALADDETTCEAILNCSVALDASFLCANDSGTEVFSCVNGYNYSAGSCTDIDECVMYDPCDTDCTNSVGSFMCSCNEGFVLGSDGLACQDVNECLDAALMGNDTLCPGQQLCENTDGGYTCTCPPGEDPTQCIDTTDAPTSKPTSETSTTTDSNGTMVSTTPTTDDPPISIGPVVGAIAGGIVLIVVVIALIVGVVFLAKLSMKSKKVRITPAKENIALREENVVPSAPEKPRLP